MLLLQVLCEASMTLKFEEDGDEGEAFCCYVGFYEERKSHVQIYKISSDANFK